MSFLDILFTLDLRSSSDSSNVLAAVETLKRGETHSSPSLLEV